MITEGEFGDEPFGLLELGSNSLKFYVVGSLKSSSPSIMTCKFPWRVAHDFFLNGVLSRSTVAELIDTVGGVKEHSAGIPLQSMLAVATGVFREVPHAADIASRIHEAMGVRVRIISGSEEAKLMARAFNRQSAAEAPTVLVDLGGATLEWAYLDDCSYQSLGSLPLGAIRNGYLFEKYLSDPADYLKESSAYCDEVLAELPICGPVQAVATGGTAKAMARCYGHDIVPLDQIRKLVETVSREGPPKFLKPTRRQVLLPGLVILWRMLVRCKSEALVYGKVSVGDGMAARLVRLLGSYRRSELHATLLLHSSQVGFES